jgi:hypothetical protein
MIGAGESVARFSLPGATYPWLYKKSVPSQVVGTSMRYWAAPMLPVCVVTVGNPLTVTLGDGVGAVDEEQAAIRTAVTATTARLTKVKPRPPGGNSDVGSRLSAVHGDR